MGSLIISAIIGAIIGVLIFFIRNAEEDSGLEGQSLEDKFHILIDGLNSYCYQGYGKVTKIDNRTLSIYKDFSCQIVYFKYRSGTLIITWKFKYFQQEMIYERELDTMGKTESWQKVTLRMLINEFLEKYKKHEARVNASGIPEKKLMEAGISTENYRKAREFLDS